MNFSKTFSNQNQIRVETLFGASTLYQRSRLAIHIILSGNVEYETKSRKVKLFSEHFLALYEPGAYACSVSSREPARVLTLMYDDKFVSDLEEFILVGVQDFPDVTSITVHDSIIEFPLTILPYKKELKEIGQELLSHIIGGSIDDQYLQALMSKALFSYYRVYESEIISKIAGLNNLKKVTRVEVFKRLLIAKDYLISNCESKIYLTDIAMAACLSVNHLLRTFQQAYGTTPYQFLLQTRLKRAATILTETTYSIDEVSYMVGAGSNSTLWKLFDKEFKTSPLKFRRRSQTPNECKPA
jgi:AraC family transcriptional regulator